MLVKVYAAALQGIDATIVTIEVNSSRGIKFFNCFHFLFMQGRKPFYIPRYMPRSAYHTYIR